MNKTTAASLAALAALTPVIALAPSAAADGSSGSTELHATLSPVPLSKVTGSGTAMVTLHGNQATVTIKATGLLANAPHAQHFHIDAKGQCPPASAAKKHNGILSINTTDGHPFYGMIGASLTTSGDTSPSSALAVDRFPSGSTVNYVRTFTVDDATAKSLRNGNAVVVLHGVDVNGNGKYDNVLGPSDLDPKLPSEATNPALCGPLKMMAKGGVAAGEGGTQESNITLPTTATAGALLAAAGAALYLRRRADQRS